MLDIYKCFCFWSDYSCFWSSELFLCCYQSDPLPTGQPRTNYINDLHLDVFMAQNNALAVFEGKQIRKIWHNEQWYFSVVDVVAILTEQEDNFTARKYWNKLSQRLKEEGSEVVTKCHQLKLPATDGKYYETDCANTETLFRIIQSIPSPKAEPFKRWLAQVGYQRVQEIENPELVQARMKELYKAKGYSEDWIEKRVRGIAIRQELTDEWKQRGIEEQRDYAILTNEISKATFGKTVEEYKDFKGLNKENLRDHMDDIELILTMLGEATTTRFTQERDSQKIVQLRRDAQEGGKVAGATRKDIEKKLGKSVVSQDNFLEQTETQKRKRLK